MLVVVVVAVGCVGWWQKDEWLPPAQAWLQSLGTKPTPAPAQAAARKCVDGQGRTHYTDQPCPAGTRERAIDGAVTSLPAIHPGPSK